MIQVKLLKLSINNLDYEFDSHHCGIYHFVNDVDDFFSFKFQIPNLIFPVGLHEEIYKNVMLFVTFIDNDNNDDNDVDVDRTEYTINIPIDSSVNNYSDSKVIENEKHVTYVKFVKNDLLVTKKKSYKIIFCLKGKNNNSFLKDGIFTVQCFLK